MYYDQVDVDNAFADYDAAQLLMQPSEALSVRNAMLCVGCGGSNIKNDSRAGEYGARVCSDCCVVQSGRIIFETMFGRYVPPRSSNYKRVHHWHERISQLLLMESRIPNEHMLTIAERLLDGTHTRLDKDTIRAVLRSLGLQIYIEKWLQVVQRITRVVPPCPGPLILKRLDDEFQELQRPFDQCKHEKRRNFLNYNYVFTRLLQRINCDKFCMFFPLIRSKHKLRALDDMWSKMVGSIGWEVTDLRPVQPFAVHLHQPETLLKAVRQTIAVSEKTVPRAILSKMEYQMLRLNPSAEAPPIPMQRRLELSEPRPLTLALRLKRRRE
tara:strand:- start:1712 stop:2689 length:978 start_codon:yes stop_codon:yes gene_type:complete